MKKYPVTEEHELIDLSELDDKSGYEIIQTVREGIPYNAFEKYASTGPFTLADWSGFLELSERSLHRYKKDNKSFDRMRSERIIELARVLSKGVEVFGNEEKFSTWMNLRIPALGGIKPRELLDSNEGIKILEAELTAIAYGIFA